jgi:putative endonuclease
MPIAGLTRWPIWRRWFGTRSERAAERYLKRLGYRTLGRNVELPAGELDLIMRHGDMIVFIEVRSTQGTDAARPADSVDLVKQKKLTQLASMWLQRNRLLDYTSRFDIVAVSWPADRKEPVIEHHVDAFPPTGRFQMYG